MSGTQPARGMRDFLPEDVRRRQYVIGVIADVYQRYGFEPLETPAVENIETLLGKYGEEGDKLIFKILKRGEGAQTGEADLALRYDLTVPLARVVAEYRAKLPKFFKRYQVQPVWRADRPQKGRFREFYQCDVDAIGSTSPVVDFEMCAAACDVLRRLGFDDFELIINHRVLLTALLRGAGIPEDKRTDALIVLDKLDKVDEQTALRELIDRGISESSASRLFSWVKVHWKQDWFDFIVDQFTFLPEERTGLQNLRAIMALAKGTSAERHLSFQPTLARGLSYYTGAIFEIKVKDLAGSLGGGGRYDNLIGMFLGQQVPATGISLGLERILVVMGERGMFPARLATTPADALVTLWNAERSSESLAIAADLRATGLRVEVYPDADKLGKQFKYASERKIPFVIVAGEDEAARGEVSVKNLTSGDQQAMPRADAATFIRRSL